MLDNFPLFLLVLVLIEYIWLFSELIKSTDS